MAEETVGAEYDGPSITALFNPAFFLDTLLAMASEKVMVSMKEGSVSYMLTGPEDPGFLSVIVSSTVSE